MSRRALRMETCPNPDLLIDCAGGILDASTLASLELHFDGCDPCRMAMVDLVALQSSTARELSITAVASLSTAPVLQPGEWVGGFEIIELKAIGGMGEVYRARDTQLGRQVALKRLRASPISQRRERLFAEARITARFHHPNIVTVYGVSEVDDRVLVALEYIEGQTLRERMSGFVQAEPVEAPNWRTVSTASVHRRNVIQAGPLGVNGSALPSEPLTLLEVTRIAGAVADALLEAHRHDVVHCDLKPSNVMLTADGRIRVVDFGLARAVDENGFSGGTPTSMSPEQWRGAEIDGSTDVWAFGVLLFELLHGRAPFTGHSLTELKTAVLEHLPLDLPAPSMASQVLHALALSCLTKIAADRPTAQDLSLAVNAQIEALLLVERAAKQWADRGSQPNEAWPINPAWAGPVDPSSESVQRFLQAGQALEHRARRRRQFGVGVTLVLLAAVAVAATASAVLFRARSAESEIARRNAQQHDAETGRESAREAWLRGDLVQARQRLHDSLELADSVPSRVLLSQLRNDPRLWVSHPSGTLFCSEWSPDQRTLAVCSGTGLWLIDASTGETLEVFHDHTAPVFSARFSSDGRLLASGDFDGTVIVRSMTDRHTLQFHAHEKTVRELRFLNDQQLVTAGRDGARLWRLAPTPTLMAELPIDRGVARASLMPDAQTLVLAGRDGLVHLWRSNQQQSTTLGEAGGPPLSALAINAAGTLLVTGDERGTLSLRSLPSGQELNRFAAHGAPINAVDFTAGDAVVSASQDHRIKRWDPMTATLLNQSDEGSAVWSVKTAPDGHSVAASSVDQQVSAFDFTRSTGAAHDAHAAEIYTLATSPDGTHLASAGVDRIILLWNVANRTVFRRLEGHSATVWHVQFSPDGQRIASASEDQMVKLWSAQSGVLLRTLGGHEGTVYGVAFSRDGAQLATACKDGKIRIFDANTGVLIRIFQGRNDGEFRSAFSSDGHQLASIGGPIAHLWDLRTGKGQRIDVEGGATVVMFSARGVLLMGPNALTLVDGHSGQPIRRWSSAFDLADASLNSTTETVTLLGKNGELASISVDSSNPPTPQPRSSTGSATELAVGPTDQVIAVAAGNAVAWPSVRAEPWSVQAERLEARTSFENQALVGDLKGQLRFTEGAVTRIAPQTPAVAVTQVLLFDGLAAAGFADGWVGVWDTRELRLVASIRVNGPVARLTAGSPARSPSPLSGQLAFNLLEIESTFSSRATLDFSILRAPCASIRSEQACQSTGPIERRGRPSSQ